MFGILGKRRARECTCGPESRRIPPTMRLCLCKLWNSGAQGRDRTTDTVIFSHVLYQLSYLGAQSGRRASAANGSPSRRPRRCPPFRDRPAGREFDTLHQAISTGRGPCSRGCRTARAPAAGLPHRGQVVGCSAIFRIPARHGKARLGTQADRSADLAASVATQCSCCSITPVTVGCATSTFAPGASKDAAAAMREPRRRRGPAPAR